MYTFLKLAPALVFLCLFVACSDSSAELPTAVLVVAVSGKSPQ